MVRTVIYFSVFALLVGIISLSSLTSQKTRTIITSAQISNPRINLSMNPRTQSIANGEQKKITVSLIPQSSADVVNAYMLSFFYTGGVIVRNFSMPTDLNGNPLNSSISYQGILTSSRRAVLYAEVSYADGTLPKGVKFDIEVQVTDPNLVQGGISLEYDNNFTSTYASEVYYDYSSYSSRYDWGTAEDASFSIQGGTSTITPQVSPNPIPTGTLTPTPTGTLTPTTVPTATPILTPIITVVPTGFAQITCGNLQQPTGLWPGGVVVTPKEGLELHWDPVPGASFYYVEIWTETPQPSGSTGIAYKKTFTGPTYTNSFRYASFSPGVRYLWKVAAVDSCGAPTTQSEIDIWVAGVQPTPSAAYPSATPTPVIPPVNINMRLRFQAIYNQPQAKPPVPKVFLVWVKNDDRETPIYKWTTAKYDGIGSWIIRDKYDLRPGDGYKVWIKGERYLQRKVCDGKPSDQESGWYHCANDNGNITIYPGDNYLDFSNIILFAGDIPFKGEGDGVLDAFDLSYIATHFGDKTNDIADLNFDGITDSQDLGVAINAIRIQKADETFPYKIHPFFRKVPLHPEFP